MEDCFYCKNKKKSKKIYADKVIIKAGKIIIHEDEQHWESSSSSSHKHESSHKKHESSSSKHGSNHKKYESSSSSSSGEYYDPWE
jgi:hypothetical protein